MRLRSLELVGFKSFNEPTTIAFAPGITAVVGPNGCGKSNVVDAIRWVLGEQAPTRLRGKSTEDLIYAGNDSNPAAGMAEVSLLLEAEDDGPLPEPYSALSEIYVTRRVYRSGESDYLLNRIPCRLKDITEFFMAAQIHSRGYSLIEQGKIEEIIQAKPAEVRSLVEEAAGLSLFKGRREISERKLERVKENLARLTDVLSEIERQLNFARRQAKKAEAYKLIKAELDELERLTAGRRLLAQRAEFASASELESELRKQVQSARESAHSLQAEAEREAAELQTVRDRLGAQSRELENLRTSAAERAHTRSFIERQLGTIDRQEPELAARAGELEAKAITSRANHAELAARLARETNAEDGAEKALAALRERFQAAAALVEQTQAQVEQLKDRISDLMSEASVMRARLGDYAGERAELDQRLRDAQAAEPEMALGIDRAQGEIAQAVAEAETRRDGLSLAERWLAQLSEAETQVRGELQHSALRLEAAREAYEGARQRAERLSLSGPAERLRSVLESFNGDGPAAPPPFFLDLVRAPAALEPALRAVLGEQSGAVVVESPNFALRAVEILKENRRGRLSFIPEAMDTVSHHAVDAPGIEGRLVDKLEVEPRFRSMVDAILGHVLLAESLPAALAASSLNGHGTVFVTRDGDVIWPGKVVSGGSAMHLTGAAENEVALSVEEARRVLVDNENEHQLLQAKPGQARAAREQAQAEIAAAKRLAAEAERAVSGKQAALAQAEQRIALARAQRDGELARVAELDSLIPAANQRLQEIALVEQEERARLADLKTTLGEQRAASEKLGEETLALAAHVDTRRARLESLQTQLRQLGELQAELDAQIGANQRGLARAASEREEFQAELFKLAALDEAARRRETEIAQRVQSLGAETEAGTARVEQRRQELAAAHEALSVLDNETIECGLRRERARTLSDELARGFIEKFQVEFDAVGGELAAALAGRNADQDEARLVELRAKRDRIGEVNLAAESEVKELEERANALGGQRADLEAAVHDLTQTIQKLNREARRRFAETFEGAAQNFAELFPKLMRGGKGRLELATPDDLLESGVNILVQPAGKKVKEIGLLSGGEKALSAMALVFSLFLLNPSPFCVLDEVDAPLDEFSVAAFTELVRDLRQHSQFIVITHNQRTMQMADHIHGVTMETPGISKIISLKLPQAA